MKIELALIRLPERDLRAHIDEDALDELAASMRDHGQLQSIGIRRLSPNTFEVVFGARRTRAATMLGWTEIDATIIDNATNGTTDAMKLIENVQRLDMTPIEEAYGLIDLIGDGEIDVRKLQRETGKSREWIKSRLVLADLPEDLQGAVQAGVLTIGVATAFGTIENKDVRDQYVQAAVDNGCTKQQAMIWATNAKYAEQGIMSMDDIARAAQTETAPPPTMDQHYNCFICATLTNWRRINTLVVCGDCQDAISENRTQPLVRSVVGVASLESDNGHAG